MTLGPLKDPEAAVSLSSACDSGQLNLSTQLLLQTSNYTKQLHQTNN